ncbi:hypothetical protein [Roseovarius autotrophicus]|uniref:hypothetical protein n=1 Tax=Roseovarius autotrophicus TaxID=2824121 RepID=UPI0019EC2F7E|nr:hypothetical protein [Roseovarius autotrophicus]MBE0455714.1 hypothetical protein [Roseovarius sp.]
MGIQRSPQEAFEAVICLLDDLAAGDPVMLRSLIEAHEALRASDAIPQIRQFLAVTYGSVR